MGRYLNIARQAVGSLWEETGPIAASNRATELRVQARTAGTWDELDGVLKEAQAAYTAGHVTCEEVESLAGYAMDRSRQIPDDGDGERLSEPKASLEIMTELGDRALPPSDRLVPQAPAELRRGVLESQRL